MVPLYVKLEYFACTCYLRKGVNECGQISLMLKLNLWLKPPPFFTAYFSSNLRLGVVFLVQQIFIFFPTFFTNLFVSVEIPDEWLRKFNAVLSAIKIVLVFAFTSAITLFFLMIRRPPRSTPLYSSAASDVYKRQIVTTAK